MKRNVVQSLTSLRLTIFILTLLFTFFGILMVANVSGIESVTLFGSSLTLAKQQVIRAIIGLGLLSILVRVPAKWITKLGPPLFVGALILLVAVLIPAIGTSINGARRWVSVAGFTFQPAEMMKMGIILYLSTWLLKERRFLSFALFLSLVFGLIILQPDLGSALIVASIASVMYFVSGKPIKHFVWLFVLGGISIFFLVLIAPYRLSRLTTFLNPESDPLGKSYHIRQITIALGNGGVFGQGLGKSRQKFRYIPEAATDSIFAIIAEELGFVGSVVILSTYGLLIIAMVEYVKLLEFEEERLIGAGIIAWLFSQMAVNIASISALIPLTGVPLPFISYGGSALVTTLASIGLFLGLGRAKGR